MTDTNQKLREALQAISRIDDSTNHAVDASAALARVGKIAYQAISLPTADHLPNAGKMIETAAPVGERELPPPVATAAKGPVAFFVKWTETGRPLNGHLDLYTADQMRAYARSALIAGDAGWQPIDTAPKDGSDCWLLVEEEVRRGFWVEIEFEERRDLDGRYIDQTDDDAYWMDKDSGDSLEPTMFYPITKPLPPAPAMRKGQL